MSQVTLEFDSELQSLEALQKAAYRLIGQATCQIGKEPGRYLCRLEAQSGGDPKELRVRFLQLVADENVRLSVNARTEPVRNLILSLAFGALVRD